ncbi:MAG: hypothetical protein S4CHLAM6_14860 [Chlamydiae bacterium]|nr:hypothetical protein [Chlamydiota bacterium]
MSSYISVKPSQIRSELEKLEETHKQNNQLRASLFNLIVYVQKNEKLPLFLELVDQIVQHFPCRVIFIEENPESSESYLDARISAKMIHVGDAPNVVCDKIYLSTSKDNCEQIQHLILEHTLVDLPIYLLWGKDPTCSHPLFPSLKHMAKRLIFHSECSNNLQELSQKLLSNVITDNWEIADLNWVYLEEWREVIKAVFNSQLSLEDLQQTTEVNIDFCATPSEYFCHNHFQVHYLHSWLAAQLGWKFVSYKDQQIKKDIAYSFGEERVHVQISEEQCGIKASPGTILSIQIKTKNKKIFTFKADTDDEMIHINIIDEEKPNKPYNTSLMKSKWQVYLTKEICYKETSKHYKQMLQILSTMDGLV